MAFNRKNWQDNVSDITAAELNRIEQGIYDNSLVVDAVTNTLNPTDTETYKTAELTEGQITDVIGVSDIIIKGQTSQDGEPTPSSPVDVNVVSGSNVVNTSNKNLWNFKNDTYIIAGITAVVKNGTITLNGTATDTAFIGIFLNNIVSWEEGKKYTISAFNSVSNNNVRIRTNADGVDDIALTAINKSSTIQYNLTTSRLNNRMSIRIQNGTTLNNFILKPQLEQSSTATTYVPHQGKELPLDLPVENMLHLPVKSGTSNNVSWSITNNGEIILNGTLTSDRIEVYPLEYKLPNGILTLSKKNSFTIAFKRANGENIFLLSNTSDTKTISNETLVNLVIYAQQGKIFNNEIIKLQLEQGSKANAYTPYGTEPIELCKIGDYQDYFYKSGSKWYLHKEIGSFILNGNVSFQKHSSSNSYFTAISHFTNNVPVYPETNNIVAPIICTHFDATYINDIAFNSVQKIGFSFINSKEVWFGLPTSIATNVSEVQNWLNNQINNENPVVVHHALATQTDTEIINTTLISQLEAIYNAPLYEETNITQENNDLPMVLDITACKDNINGIKAFIRK